MVEPAILLLDEPLSNLDAKLRERMRTELKELQRRTGITFVYVTHDQAEALALSDQIAVMSGGRLQQYGTPLEVYAHPANRMVADFMGLVNLVPGKVREVANGSGKVELDGGLALDVAVAWTDCGRARASRSRSGRKTSASPRRPRRGGRLAKITNHVFLGNISEYQRRCVADRCCACRPIRRSVPIGDAVAVEVDATQCSVFRRGAGV